MSETLLATLRARLANPSDFTWEQEWAASAGQAAAGVLIAIAPTPQGASILLTRRTDHLYHHPGQICFPGGRIEPEDGSAIDAALRETEEEIGLQRGKVDVLGVLPDYATSSGFCVTPVVAVAAPGFVPQLDAFEVAELFSVPLAFVLDRNNYQRHRVVRQGRVHHFLAIPHAGRFIWGATAGMLAMLASFMATGAEHATRRAVASPPLGASAASQLETGLYFG